MLTIRLQRVGRTKQAYFRVVLTDSKNSSKSGRFVEVLGSYNPKAGETILNADRVKYWLKNGAKASDTIHNVLVSQKIVEGKKRNVLSKKAPTVKKKEAKKK